MLPAKPNRQTLPVFCVIKYIKRERRTRGWCCEWESLMKDEEDEEEVHVLFGKRWNSTKCDLMDLHEPAWWLHRLPKKKKIARAAAYNQMMDHFPIHSREWASEWEKAISVYEVVEGAQFKCWSQRGCWVYSGKFSRRRRNGLNRYYELHIFLFFSGKIGGREEREITGWLNCHYFIAWAHRATIESFNEIIVLGIEKSCLNSLLMNMKWLSVSYSKLFFYNLKKCNFYLNMCNKIFKIY